MKTHTRYILVVVLILSLTLSVSLCASAATGIYIGRDTVTYAGGTVNYDVAAYIYYNSNTAAMIDIYSLSQIVYNNCNYSLNQVSFQVRTGNFNKDTTSAGSITPIENGHSRYMEQLWLPVCQGYDPTWDTKFSKNDSAKYVYTDLLAGMDWAALGGWETFWYPSSRSSFFHW